MIPSYSMVGFKFKYILLFTLNQYLHIIASSYVFCFETLELSTFDEAPEAAHGTWPSLRLGATER